MERAPRVPHAMQMFCSWMLPPSCARAACVGTQQLCHSVTPGCVLTADAVPAGLGRCGDRWLCPCHPQAVLCWEGFPEGELSSMAEGLLPPTVTVPLSPASRDAPSSTGASSPAPGLRQELGRQCHMTTCHHPLRHCHLSVTAPAQPHAKGCGCSPGRAVGDGGEGNQGHRGLRGHFGGRGTPGVCLELPLGAGTVHGDTVCSHRSQTTHSCLLWPPSPRSEEHQPLPLWDNSLLFLVPGALSQHQLCPFSPSWSCPLPVSPGWPTPPSPVLSQLLWSPPCQCSPSWGREASPGLGIPSCLPPSHRGSPGWKGKEGVFLALTLRLFQGLS